MRRNLNFHDRQLRTTRVTLRLQRATTEGDNDVAAPLEVPISPMKELKCRERLQIRVPKHSSESDQNESESDENERFL